LEISVRKATFGRATEKYCAGSYVQGGERKKVGGFGGNLVNERGKSAARRGGSASRTRERKLGLRRKPDRDPILKSSANGSSTASKGS